MRYEHIVWDFNGTLIDDVSLGIGATNTLLLRRGLSPIDRELYYREFGFPIKDYYARIGFDFSRERYEDVADEWILAYREGEKDVPLREGVLTLLETFRARGLRQTVLSASEQGMLGEQLTALGIRSYFERVIGRSDVCATDKTSLARTLGAALAPARVLMIGDTDHDAACAAAAGFDCALLCGGHQPRERLAALHGVRCFADPAALLDTLCKEGRI